MTGSATVSTNVTPLPPAYQEWWRPLAVGALMLLVIEWLVYHRSKVLKMVVYLASAGWKQVRIGEHVISTREVGRNPLEPHLKSRL
ncbi:MAG: hypothetical protein U0401_06020 [Anaerolineae bacterium]